LAREVGRRGLTFGETFRTLASELRIGRKDAAFPAVAMYQNPNPFTSLSATWVESTPEQQLKQYSTNALVFACIRVIAESFAEAELCAYNKAGDKLPSHPLKRLIARPNPIMGEDELWKYFITYAGFGGSGFLHQVLTRGGEPGELWPYHRVQMAPVPKGNRWVDHYSYDLGNGQYQRVETNEVIHWRWAIDPARPWDALSPLAVIAKAIGTHDELARYIKAVLENDAVPRGVLTLPADVILTAEKRNELKQDWNRRHGGQNRGGLAIMPAGGKYERAAFTLRGAGG
jgi:HK97 family phage portal protein